MKAMSQSAVQSSGCCQVSNEHQHRDQMDLLKALIIFLEAKWADSCVTCCSPVRHCNAERYRQHWTVAIKHRHVTVIAKSFVSRQCKNHNVAKKQGRSKLIWAGSAWDHLPYPPDVCLRPISYLFRTLEPLLDKKKFRYINHLCREFIGLVCIEE
ncbi:hypothetical protein KIN20_025051 [Parelaphostrongylus tenuis]|uniref:Uncharacterized protein n=1 Tax=Parelaphostrongylus tenuis TaxID=148309 RepID=A0AAD5MZ04_PARTN|nr:hypothetical protein KIN20_025051 [Parelaphostrongylus tenuis]